MRLAYKNFGAPERKARCIKDRKQGSSSQRVRTGRKGIEEAAIAPVEWLGGLSHKDKEFFMKSIPCNQVSGGESK